MGDELIEACKENNLYKLKQLLKSSDHHDTINEIYSWPGLFDIKGTVLSYSCQFNTHAFVEALLNNGASDCIADSDGDYAIHRACLCSTDTSAKVKLLVEHNPDNIHKTKQRQITPIMLVTCNDTLEYLLQKGARVNDIDGHGQSALHWASMFNTSTSINTLLKYGADVNLCDHKGDTPLHLAANWANVDAIKALVASDKCDININNKNGDTPLHVGVCSANGEVVKALVYSPECDVNRKNTKGETAFDVARSKPNDRKKYENVYEYLENII